MFFTGAFRKPRELNWLIGVILLILGFIEGLAGYSLPDDLLSGTGLRITEGAAVPPRWSAPTCLLPLRRRVPRRGDHPGLYTVHVLLIPGIFLALITGARLILVSTRSTRSTPGRAGPTKNAVGFPFFPVYTAKAGGFFFITFGVIALLSAFASINPIWASGPTPDLVSRGLQPDWYMGFLEGALRLLPTGRSTPSGYDPLERARPGR